MSYSAAMGLLTSIKLLTGMVTSKSRCK
jgi:hypothetical protein